MMMMKPVLNKTLVALSVLVFAAMMGVMKKVRPHMREG